MQPLRQERHGGRPGETGTGKGVEGRADRGPYHRSIESGGCLNLSTVF